MTDELEGLQKEAGIALPRHCPSCYLKELWTITNISVRIAVPHMRFYSIASTLTLAEKLINGFREPYGWALRNQSQDSKVLQHKVWETLAYRRLATYRKCSGDTKLVSLKLQHDQQNFRKHKKKGEPKKNSAYTCHVQK